MYYIVAFYFYYTLEGQPHECESTENGVCFKAILGLAKVGTCLNTC